METVCITVDCTDPATVASFWNEALRGGGVSVTADGTSAICGPIGGGPYLEFIRVPESKSVKNRGHLGCSVPELEQLDGEIARIEALGAAVAGEEEFPPEIAASYRNVMLRDVEGNDICLGAGTFPG